MNHEPGFLRGFCVCVPRVPMCLLFFKTSNIPGHEKNLNLSFLERQDSSLMFGYLQHRFGILKVTRIAYTIATPNDGGFL